MQYSMKRVTLTSMQELCLLSSEMIEVAHEDIEFPEDPRFQMNRLLDTFITKAASVR